MASVMFAAFDLTRNSLPCGEGTAIFLNRHDAAEVLKKSGKSGEAMDVARFRDHLYVIKRGGEAILYDVNRVTTYACNEIEAHLLGDAKNAIAGASERLDRLLKLSTSLANCGLQAPYSGHPNSLFLNLSHACNLKCAYCYSSGCLVDDAPRFMGRDEVMASVEYLLQGINPGEAASITFAGGEPLLNFRAIKAAVGLAHRRQREKGVSIQYRILTNGTIMDAELLRFILAHGIWIQISLDGPPETHDRLRRAHDGSGTFDKVERTIRFLKENGYPRFSVRSTVCHGNSDLSKITRFMEGKGLKDIYLRPVIAGPGESVRLTEQDVSKVCAFYNKASKRLVEDGAAELPEDFSVYVNRLTLGLKTKRHCGAGRDLLVVTPGGAFYPCPSLAGDPRYRLGTLADGLDRESFENLSVDEKPKCRQCWARNLCGGGCVAQAAKTTGDLRDPDPLECKIIKAKIAGAISIYHRRKETVPV